MLFIVSLLLGYDVILGGGSNAGMMGM